MRVSIYSNSFKESLICIQLEQTAVIFALRNLCNDTTLGTLW